MRFSLATALFSLAIFVAAIPRPTVKNSGIAIKLTKHAHFTNTDNPVDVDALDAHVASLSAKVLRGFDNYEKNTGKTHPYAMSGIQERGAGAPLTSDRARSWHGDISIGTPPKTFSVEIDSGSSDLFVPWELCDGSCDGHALWDPSESNTAAKSLLNGKHKGFFMTYHDGSRVLGMQFEDNVTISGFTADKQTIGAAMSYSTQLHKDNWAPDGMLGVAFPSISIYPATPLLATLVDSKAIEPVFSLELTPDGGELYIGGVNPDLYKGGFTFTPVTEKGFWQIEIQSIQDVSKGNVALTNIPAIIDTGANYIIGDSTRVADMYKVFGGTNVHGGYYCFPCNSFPAISLSFDGKSFKIPPELLNLGRISRGSDKCFGSIVAKDMPSPSLWVIGSAFLRGYYTTFEFGESPRVGFAELR